MKNNVIILRMSYWFGAILDGIMVIPMLFSNIGGIMFGINNFHPGSDYRYAMMIGASLMAGWTVLLIWADRKPVERKGIILITVFPVVMGIMLSGVYAVNSGLIRMEKMAPTLILQTILLILFVYGYFSTAKDVKGSPIHDKNII